MTKGISNLTCPKLSPRYSLPLSLMCFLYSLSHLSKWQLYPSSGSNQKPGYHSWLFPSVFNESANSWSYLHRISRIWPLLSSPQQPLWSQLPLPLTLIVTGASCLFPVSQLFITEWQPIPKQNDIKQPFCYAHGFHWVGIQKRLSGDSSSLFHDIWGLDRLDLEQLSQEDSPARWCPHYHVQAGSAEKKDKPGLWVGLPQTASTAGRALESFLVNEEISWPFIP